MQPDDRYVDQSLEALRLTVIEDDLDLGQFDILDEGYYAPPSREVAVEARIIGASHVVTFAVHASGLQVHEIVACVTAREAEGRLLSGLMYQQIVQQFGDWRYVFKAESVPWDGGEPHRLQMFLSLAPQAMSYGGVGLVHDFPVGDLPATPRTVILAGKPSRDGALAVSTAHSYPGEGVVFTCSTLYKEVS